MHVAVSPEWVQAAWPGWKIVFATQGETGRKSWKSKGTSVYVTYLYEKTGAGAVVVGGFQMF